MIKLRKILICLSCLAICIVPCLKRLNAQNFRVFDILTSFETGFIDINTGDDLNDQEADEYVRSVGFIRVDYTYTYTLENWVDYPIWIFCYESADTDTFLNAIFSPEGINYNVITFPVDTYFIRVSYYNDPNGPLALYNTGIIESYYNEGLDSGYNSGLQYGTEQGKQSGYQNGYNVGYNSGKQTGFNDGFISGYDKGYDDAVNLEHSQNVGFTNLLTSMFKGVGDILSVELFNDITIGHVVAVPLVFGVAMFILGRKVEK